MKRGRILRDTNIGAGLLTVDGTQYTFSLEGMWKSDVPPRIGMPVDVNFDQAGVPETVYAVSDAQVARDHTETALAGARSQTGALMTGGKGRFPISILVVEGIMLLAFLVLPSLQVGAGFGAHALTGWEAANFDMASMGGSGQGAMGLVVLLCLLAPFAIPIVKAGWARWLYILPFTASVLACVNVILQIENAGRAAGEMAGGFGGAQMARQMGNAVGSMFSPGAGTAIVLLCAAFLLTRAFKKIH